MSYCFILLCLTVLYCCVLLDHSMPYCDILQKQTFTLLSFSLALCPTTALQCSVPLNCTGHMVASLCHRSTVSHWNSLSKLQCVLLQCCVPLNCADGKLMPQIRDVLWCAIVLVASFCHRSTMSHCNILSKTQCVLLQRCVPLNCADGKLMPQIRDVLWCYDVQLCW